VHDMFEMTVSDVFTIHNKHLVSGKHNGERLKRGKIIDEKGKEYDFYIPYLSTSDEMQLQLIADNIDINSIIGQKLYQR